MKWVFSLLAFAALQAVSAVPVEESNTLVKRAAAGDVANIGYATLNGGTSGGSGGTVTRVSTLAALTAAVAGDAKKIVILTASLSGAAIVKVGGNTSLLGASGSVTLTGIGIRIINVKNVIVRNLKIAKVLADTGDALGVQAASQVWLDHLDLSSDRSHDKDYYDGLLDATHGVTGLTVSYTKLHDHWKTSLVGHSDSNSAEDTKITVSYANNVWTNLSSRAPSFRFGTGHIWNNVFDGVSDGINTRVGAQLLVENNLWTGTKKPLYSTSSGFAVARGNDFGGASNTAPAGTFTKAPYSYTLVAASAARSAASSAGATLSF